jgi:hypothetical protein
MKDTGVLQFLEIMTPFMKEIRMITRKLKVMRYITREDANSDSVQSKKKNTAPRKLNGSQPMCD